MIAGESGSLASPLPARDVPVTPMLIGGELCSASDGSSTEVINPATEQVVARVPRATDADIESALRAACEGWRVWRGTGPWRRSEALRAVASVLRTRSAAIAAVLTEEQGKPAREAEAEVLATCEQFEWFADEARRIRGEILPTSDPGHSAAVIREPIGPVAAFAPWNFPALLPARKLAPALAAGCSVILKPADEAPRVAFELAKACEEAAIPAGVVNVVTGAAPEVCSQLLRSDVIRKVTVTASVPVGRAVLHTAAGRILDTTLELGGHAPVIVLGDVDPADAARRCVAAKYRNAGQVCISPTRFFVADRIYRRFCDEFVAAASRLVVGDGSDKATDVGPVSTRTRLTQLCSQIEAALEAGATLGTGGRAEDRATGYFLKPTVLVDVPETAAIMREEPFGPVALLSRYSELHDAVTRANQTPYGLAAYVLSDDLWVAQHVARALEAGMVGINHFALSYAGVPFGGVKSSGLGSESGSSAMDAYLTCKAIHVGAPMAGAGAKSMPSEQL